METVQQATGNNDVKREAHFVKRQAQSVSKSSPENQPAVKKQDSKIAGFRDLIVWQVGKQIVCSSYRLCQTLPKDERYGLSSQIKRSALSIPSNIAEGFNRFHNKEYRQFLYTALGSCAELETQLEIGADLSFFTGPQCKDLLEKLDHENRTLRSLVRKL